MLSGICLLGERKKRRPVLAAALHRATKAAAHVADRQRRGRAQRVASAGRPRVTNIHAYATDDEYVKALNSVVLARDLHPRTWARAFCGRLRNQCPAR